MVENIFLSMLHTQHCEIERKYMQKNKQKTDFKVHLTTMENRKFLEGVVPVLGLCGKVFLTEGCRGFHCDKNPEAASC